MIIFPFPGYEELAKNISEKLPAKLGKVNVREFPDKESFVRIDDEVKGEDVILLCGLDQPNTKALATIFFADTAKEMGAKSVGLVTPYLGYMRQDIRFHKGEAISSNIFASVMSKHFNWMVTVDPHLHRHKTLDEIYSIPSIALHATEPVSEWIKKNVKNPVIIGPDEESGQWVSAIANQISVPYEVLTKTRYGDEDVKVSLPNIDSYRNSTPVLVDDIISTARTMVETVGHLIRLGMPKPICIGVHAVFAKDAYELLKSSGALRIATCNSISHHSNEIDLSKLIADGIKRVLR